MANLNPPEALKQIKPYLTLATQLEQKSDKCVAYYCRLYAVQHGMAINKSAPECKKFLFQLMDVLEETKKQNKSDESIHSEVVGQAVVERFALKLFEKADDEDRQAKFNKNLVKQFYSAGLLFDVLNCFGELSEDLIAKKQYAKRKAMYLNKCFQTGETPIPGPLTDEFNPEEFGQETTTQQQDNYMNFKPTNETNQEPINYEPRPSSKSNHQIESNYYEDTNPSPNTSISADLIQKAQKFCKHAQSAMQYDDIPTAITNLENCLKILKTGKL